MIALLAILPEEVRAQPPDSAGAVPLAEVVVRAERTPIPLSRAVGAITLLQGEQLRAFPGRTLADALQQVPGLSFVDFSGGGDPQAMVRGFYGGGEADYVLILVDDEPANSLNGGRVNWDLIPLSAVESIEVLRGTSSSIYGDAAVGAVIHVRTLQRVNRSRWTLSAGERRLRAGSWAGGVGGVSAFADVARHSGYRAHAARRTASGGATATFHGAGQGSLVLSAISHDRQQNEPGPIAGSPRVGAQEVNTFFRFDRASERVHRLALRATRGDASRTRVSARVGWDTRRADEVRTLPLSLDFADTKHRLVNTSTVHTLWDVERALPDVRGKILVGMEASHGRMGTDHSAVLSGDGDTYRTADAPPFTPEADGDGRRSALAGMMQLEVIPVASVRLVAGVRADRLRDRFSSETGDAQRTAHSAVSPRFGANVRYRATNRERGHLFASISRSFKAPTPDQLFGQRSIPVPFPPFAVSLANDELRPQHARAVEVGARHWMGFPTASVDVSVVAYDIRMRDEVDFAIEQLRFINIGRSRHRGIESSLSASIRAGSLFLNHSLDDTRSASGEHTGRRLKALPRSVLRAGARSDFGGWRVAVTIMAAQGAFLDDANERRLPGFERADVRLARTIGPLEIAAEVTNVFDRKYSSTGFLDPGGSGVALFYPAAGRVLRVTAGTVR